MLNCKSIVTVLKEKCHRNHRCRVTKYSITIWCIMTSAVKKFSFLLLYRSIIESLGFKIATI